LGWRKTHFFMNLFILRHGTAVNSEQDLKDFDRKLSEDGILQAIKIADFLKNENIEQIICSSAIRAFETANIVDQIIKVDLFEDFKTLYLADLKTIKSVIAEIAVKKNVLFVGHNFGISDLATDLTGKSIQLSTCMLVKTELEVQNWSLISNDTCTLKSITEPNSL